MFNYSTQATVYLILVIITSIINLICYYMMAGILGFIGYLLYILITIPLIILWMYNIDCLTTGDCQIWSWVITALTLVSVISATVILVAVAVNPSLRDNYATTTFTTTTNIPKATTIPVVTIPAAAAATTTTTTPAAAAATPAAAATTPAATAAATPAAATPAAAATTTPPTTPPAAPPISDADQKHNMSLFQQMWTDDKQFMEDQFQKQKYISGQFERKDLTRDEKNALWRQQLEYEYKNLVNTEKNLQKIIVNAKGFPPEILEEYRNMSKINQRLIQQRDKMTIEYPAFLGTFNPELIESIKLQIKLIIEQKQIIQQELLKSGITNDEKKALQQQLVILQKVQDERPPKEGTFLYDAYVASNK